MYSLAKCYLTMARFVSYLKCPLLLLLRLFFGWQFYVSGTGKLHNIEATTKFFEGLHIPMPGLNAYMAGGTEAVCGLMLLFGVAARFASIPLICTMIVAYATAHREQVFDDVWTKPLLTAKEFVKAAPFNFLLTSLLVLICGPGWVSVDGIVKAILQRQARFRSLFTQTR